MKPRYFWIHHSLFITYLDYCSATRRSSAAIADVPFSDASERHRNGS
ncbi:hypothetical protein SPWS13_3228 [Shewanella putrefaciens]|nr:hypothetical protein SPWS13_3228 [Shewanella putrefaciens]